jgi:hypothetical protein
MCTLVLFFRAFSDYPLVLAANRDEVLVRPSAGPTKLWASPWIYGGQDLLAGGTWLGVNQHGVTVGVLNRQSLAAADPHRRSRGQLCLDALKCGSATEAVQTIMAQTPHAYNPFNLVIVDHGSAYVIDNHRTDFTVHPLPPGVHLITNRDPNDQTCARIARFAPLFADLHLSFNNHPLELPQLFAALRHRMGEHAVADKEARDGLCLHLDGYGTRSSTLLAYSLADRRFHYHFAPGPPCRTRYNEVPLPLTTCTDHPPSTI